MLSRLATRLRAWAAYTRPFDPAYEAVVQARLERLPAALRSNPATLIGQCEGTQGVFPACNFACSPCYHSKDANHVPVDAEHTLREIKAQMELLRERLGSPRGGQHSQLIGGEVTLLGPQTHAEAIKLMQSYNRIPMSFTHGDFDYEYLDSLVKAGGGQITHLAFAGHFDTTMAGRRKLYGETQRARSEGELDVYRQRFCDMFRRLKRERGVTSFLAHNMTVTPRNLREIPDVIQLAKHQGWGMMSFQPAAYMGFSARWKDRYEDLDEGHGDPVWQQIEKGIGRKLPWKMLQAGDSRCNRTVWGLLVGDTYHPLWEEHPIDERWRDAFVRIGKKGGSLYDPKAHYSVIRFVRALASEPADAVAFLRWALRLVWRCGPLQLLTQEVRNLTLVMHRFMDAKDVAAAYELQQQGKVADDPKIRETQERLDGCFYSMAHPETGEVVSACVQHSVLDPEINKRLRVELGGSPPVVRKRRQASL